jgi:hypothetical protein
VAVAVSPRLINPQNNKLIIEHMKIHINQLSFKVTLALLTISAFCFQIAALAQLSGTFSSNCLTGPVTLTTTSSNLVSTQYNTNRVWQGRHLGIGLSFGGGSATNTGLIGFQFAVLANGVNQLKSTTRPFTITSVANGTAPVVDWAVLPNYTLGPADALVLVGITNAAVNVNPAAAGSVTVSNVWIQTDTRP